MAYMSEFLPYDQSSHFNKGHLLWKEGISGVDFALTVILTLKPYVSQQHNALKRDITQISRAL